MTKAGLGYVGTDVSAGVYFALDRLHESRGELSGELLVERVPEGHLLRGRFNVSSIATRKATATYLSDRANGIDWREALEQLCLQVLDKERTGLPFVTVGDRPPAAEEPYLLAPILRERAPTILFGEGGAGKSFLAGAMIVSVASGIPVVHGWEVRRQGSVIVLDWESDEDDWNDRIAWIAKGAGLKPPDVTYRRGAGLSLVDQVEAVAQQVARQDAALIVIDSVGTASPSGREGVDANDTTIRMFKALDMIGTTSLLIDHVSKSGADRAAGAGKPYGSVFKENRARSTYELRAGDMYGGLRHLLLIHRKVNRGAKQEPVGIAVEHGEGYVRFDVEDVSSPALMASLKLWQRIQAYLEDQGPSQPKDIAAGIDVPRNQVSRELTRHKIFRRWDDGRWTVTTAYFGEPDGEARQLARQNAAWSDDFDRRFRFQGPKEPTAATAASPRHDAAPQRGTDSPFRGRSPDAAAKTAASETTSAAGEGVPPKADPPGVDHRQSTGRDRETGDLVSPDRLEDLEL